MGVQFVLGCFYAVTAVHCGYPQSLQVAQYGKSKISRSGARAWYNDIGQGDQLVLDPYAASIIPAYHDVHVGVQYHFGIGSALLNQPLGFVASFVGLLLLYDPCSHCAAPSICLFVQYLSQTS